jgi:hypothetical protein
MIGGVHVVVMGQANGFLIDVGYPGKETAVFTAMRKLGRSPALTMAKLSIVPPRSACGNGSARGQEGRSERHDEAETDHAFHVANANGYYCESERLL